MSLFFQNLGIESSKSADVEGSGTMSAIKSTTKLLVLENR